MKLTEKMSNLYKVVEAKEEVKSLEIIKEMVDKDWSKDNKMQEYACNEMKKLAEMDDKDANKFMEYMDEMSSEYGKEKEDDKEIDEAVNFSGADTAIDNIGDYLNALKKASTSKNEKDYKKSLKSFSLEFGRLLDHTGDDQLNKAFNVFVSKLR